MSSVVENQTRLTGRVLSREPHPGVPRWDRLAVHVTAADAVPGQANLLGELVGLQVTLVANHDELPDGALDGWHFTGAVRLAGPDLVEALPEGAGAGSPELTPPAPGEPPVQAGSPDLAEPGDPATPGDGPLPTL